MMYICHSSHRDKRQVMQEPADDWIDTTVVYLVDLNRLEFSVAALPTDEVPAYERKKASKGRCASPVHNRVAQEEVLDDVIIPAAHAKANIQDRPLPEMGCEVVLLVRVRNQGVVGSHHRDIEVHEITEERRFVRPRVTGWHCGHISLIL